MSSRFDHIRQREAKVFLPTYARYPIAVAQARGNRIIDVDGREYVDLLAGIAVCNLGHCHPEITEVMASQADTLVHVSNLFYGEAQLELAEKLLSTCHLERVFLCNSGAEANEAAIKLARRYMQIVQGRDAFEIISLNGSFHGRTLGTLAATGQPGLHQGFAPLPAGFSHVDPEDIQALDQAAGPQTAAVLIEIIQGEGGVRPLSPAYVQAVERLCRERKLLLMVDEVQTGLARTGTMWAHQYHGLKPDVLTTAKALANGLPMGAMLASSEVGQGFAPGSHATTFGGGALLSRVASTVLDIIQRDNLAEKAGQTGDFALQSFSALKDEFPSLVTDVRGRGLMLGIELAHSGQEVWNLLLESGFVLNLSHGRVLRLLPPLTISREDIASFTRTLQEILHKLSS